MTLKQLVRSRDSIKLRLETLKLFSSTLEREKPTIADVEFRVDRYKDLYDEFDAVQKEVEQKCADVDVEDHYEVRRDFERDFFNVMGILKHYLLVNTPNVSTPSISHSNQPVNDTFQTNFLPKIKLPTFKGEYEHWLNFKTNYLSIVHNNNAINKANKYNFLRTSLDGYAKQIIDGIDFVEDQYDTAWETLCKRFDKKRILANNHVKAIFKTESIKKESAQAYRKLLDETSTHLAALKNLKLTASESSDIYLIYLITSKLDFTLQKKWEEFEPSLELPTLKEFFEFLNKKADALENWQHNQPQPCMSRDLGHSTTNLKRFTNYKNPIKCNLAIRSITCNFCQGEHTIYSCSKFLQFSPIERQDKVKNLKLCTNCLRKNHTSEQCRQGHCKKCPQKHSTLLHNDTSIIPTTSTNSETNLLVKNHIATQVLLSTVTFQVKDNHNNLHTARAILDSGAQSNLITQEFCQKLNIPLTSTYTPIIGINQTESIINKKCSVTLFSNNSDFTTTMNCLVVPNISNKLPSQLLHYSSWNIPDNINLSDPHFYEPNNVDMLIGAGEFWNLLSQGQIKLGKNLPIIQNTKLGWVISGLAPINKANSHSSVLNFSVNHHPEDKQLTKFWELEEIPQTKFQSQDDLECEQLFLKHTSRTSNGQFIVKLPFKYSPELLGESFDTAVKRFYSLEKKLSFKPQLKVLYKQFIDEYKKLNHLHEVVTDNPKDSNNYYLPHHSVYKESSVTTQLRVVFDGSCKTTTGWSLNDLQYIGPKIQNNIFDILIRFRQYTYAVSADVSKMYRQILMHTDHQPFHRIIWRDEPDRDISILQLSTVTYGTTAAPYLAIRCLNQLAEDNSHQLPLASHTILNDFYVDDLLTGSDDLPSLEKVCQEISSILKSGHFQLRKWISNSKEFLSKIPDVGIANSILHLGETESSKTLGIQWASQPDLLSYVISSSEISSATKRSILAYISKIYDPLGLLSPIIITSKIIIQKLWANNTSWDEPIPNNLHELWNEFSSQLHTLNNLKIPRNVIPVEFKIIELHCFSDASQSAYASCIYVRSFNFNTSEFKSHLLCSKSKVSPIKPTTIPRLELCAALLGTQLCEQVKSALACSVPIIYWSDSQIVLAWLNLEPVQLQQFVANRIFKIQEATDIKNWHYVPSQENPADLASRGIQPAALINSQLWWKGPNFLCHNSEFWPSMTASSNHELPEIKNQAHVMLCKNKTPVHPTNSLFIRYSSLHKLIRVTAYIFRFIQNIKFKIQAKSINVHPLNAHELNHSQLMLIKLAQSEIFESEIKLLESNKQLPKKHRLLSLQPFLDKDKILRVGGRLRFTSLNYNTKHPILLDSKHIISKLIFRQKHQALLHAGNQCLLSAVRQIYWVIGAKNLAKQVIRECLTCFKAKPNFFVAPMSSLPNARVSPSFPFQHTGIDYAGPFFIADRKGRGRQVTKAYVCTFVCFSTKAIHLELVSNLTSEHFLACLRRFTSRRGVPSHIYSDNGTTFIGAYNDLKELGQFLYNNQKTVSDYASSIGFIWHFIPPYSPNFGGLWESSVKSMKFHFKRVLKDAIITYEEFNTLLVQVEGILNSRPLFALSTDPSDLTPLSPSHFLLGRSIVTPPDLDVQTTPPNRLTRLQFIQQLQQQFWNRFSKEYVTHLHNQYKWKENPSPIEAGNLVIIKNSQLPSFRWHIGRVVKLFPGKDNVSRVVEVKTTQGVIKRSVRDLCPLPCPEQ